MGFIIVDPGCRGKGYGREMVRLALQYARLCLGLDFVTLGVYDCNEPARRLYEAEGFVKATGWEKNRPAFAVKHGPIITWKPI